MISQTFPTAASNSLSTATLSESSFFVRVTSVLTTGTPFPTAYCVSMDFWIIFLDSSTEVTRSNPLAMLAVMNAENVHPDPCPALYGNRGFLILVISDDR